MPGIEGLRALAATSVLAYHVWLFSSPDGHPIAEGRELAIPVESLALGVTLFFALSGFLLYRPFLVAAFEPERRPRVAAYFRNRALRIVPAYWVILLLAALVLQSTRTRDGAVLEIGPLTGAGDLLSAGLLVHDYRPSTMLIGIAPAWSLAVEVVFYLAVPVLGAMALALAARTRGSRGVLLAFLAPAVLMLAIGLSGKLAAAYLVEGPGPNGGWDADWHSVVVRSFWAQADLFAFGMVVAAVHVQVSRGALNLPSWWRQAAVAVAVPVGAVAAIRLADVNGQLGYPVENTVIAACLAVLLALVVIPGPMVGPSPSARAFETRAAVTVGIVSYSVFLWNEPVIQRLADVGVFADGRIGLALNFAVVAAVVFVLSVVTYRLVELPAMRLKAPMSRGMGPEALEPRPRIAASPDSSAG